MQELYDDIERYLDGEMPPGERPAFEKRVENDPAAAEAFAAVREARARLARRWAEAESDAALAANLRELGRAHFAAPEIRAEKSPGAPTTRTVPMWQTWRFAAAAAVLFLAAALWFLVPSGPPAQRLYAAHRKFPEAAFVQKSAAPTDRRALEEAQRFFNQKNYAAALERLGPWTAARPEDTEAAFFAALCQLEIGRTGEAEAVFRRISEGPSTWAGDARWFLALAQLKAGQAESCLETLRKIPPGDAHGAAARALGEQLAALKN